MIRYFKISFALNFWASPHSELYGAMALEDLRLARSVRKLLASDAGFQHDDPPRPTEFPTDVPAPEPRDVPPPTPRDVPPPEPVKKPSVNPPYRSGEDLRPRPLP